MVVLVVAQTDRSIRNWQNSVAVAVVVAAAVEVVGQRDPGPGFGCR